MKMSIPFPFVPWSNDGTAAQGGNKSVCSECNQGQQSLVITRQVANNDTGPRSSQEACRSGSESGRYRTRHRQSCSTAVAVAKMGACQQNCSLQQLPREAGVNPPQALVPWICQNPRVFVAQPQSHDFLLPLFTATYNQVTSLPNLIQRDNITVIKYLLI